MSKQKYQVSQFLGFCKRCRDLLTTVDEFWKDQKVKASKRRVECRKCGMVCKQDSLLKTRTEQRPRRTIWPEPTYQEMVADFRHMINLYQSLSEEFILERKKKYEELFAGLDESMSEFERADKLKVGQLIVIRAIKDAAQRTNWDDNDWLADMVRQTTKQKPFPMIQKFRRY